MRLVRSLVPWRSFVSRGTVITGLLAILVWGLLWNWAAAVALVLLLYVHELGHVLAALWRRVPVQRAPLFLPGFGAIVQVQSTEQVWDDVLVALGGPLVGGLVAVAARAAGGLWDQPALVAAGDLGFFLNVANLLPFKPLDGGRVVARTGWLGFMPALLLGVGLLALNVALRSGLLLSAIVVIGLVWGYRTLRQERSARLATRLGILALYLLTGLALTGAYTASVLPALVRQATAPTAGVASRPAQPAGVFLGPSGVAVDGEGNLYVVDTYNDRIQKLAPDGRPLARWGGSGRAPGQFDAPLGIALDAAGNLYVADSGNNRVQQLSPRGEPLAAWGRAGTEPGEFYGPSGIALDPRGAIYLTDLGNMRVQRLSPTGQPLATWPLDEGDPGDGWGLAGIAVDRQGNLYVASPGSARVTRLSPDGAVLARFAPDPAEEFSQLSGLALDLDGNLLVADAWTGRLTRLSPAGEPLDRWAAPSPGPRQTAELAGVAVDGRGNLYVAGWGRDRIGKLSPAGELLALWGADATRPAAASDGSPATPGWLPGGVLLEGLALAFLVVALLDAVAWRYAMQPRRGAAGRFFTLALATWPRALLSDPWWIPFNACLAAHVAGLPGLRWLEALVRRLGARRNLAAGVGCALAYDCLHRQGRDAESWLARLTPTLQAAGVETVVRTFSGLLLLGHRGRTYGWFIEALAAARPEELPWLAANNLAYGLALAGRHADALPFARAALAQQPAGPQGSYVQGTLGEVLLGLGDAPGAEAHLRESLRLQEQPVNRLALGRALAAQGRYDEAIAEAERGLREHKGPWLEDEPGPDAVRGWLAEWRAAGSGPAAPQPSPAGLAAPLPGTP